jgi:hypothetical protein
VSNYNSVASYVILPQNGLKPVKLPNWICSWPKPKSELEAQLQTAEMQHARQLELLQYHYPALTLPVLHTLPVPSPATAEHRIEAIMEDNHELELATLEADYAKLQLSRTAKDEMPDPVIGIRAARERNGQDTLVGFSIAIPLGGQSRRADTGQAAGKAGMAQARLDVVRQKSGVRR